MSHAPWTALSRCSGYGSTSLPSLPSIIYHSPRYLRRLATCTNQPDKPGAIDCLVPLFVIQQHCLAALALNHIPFTQIPTQIRLTRFKHIPVHIGVISYSKGIIHPGIFAELHHVPFAQMRFFFKGIECHPHRCQNRFAPCNFRLQRCAGRLMSVCEVLIAAPIHAE